MLFTKDGIESVEVSDKFIYSDDIYYKFKEGIAIYKSTYYTSDKPVKLKKKDFKSKSKNGCYFIRFFTLEYAPINYLLENGYKKR